MAKIKGLDDANSGGGYERINLPDQEIGHSSGSHLQQH